MSVDERHEAEARASAGDTVAGFMAAAALAAGVIALVWYPGRLGPAAMLVALIAAGMGSAQRRLAAGALVVITLCWLTGMIVAVLLNRPIF
jgi:hypothetical protein